MRQGKKWEKSVVIFILTFIFIFVFVFERVSARSFYFIERPRLRLDFLFDYERAESIKPDTEKVSDSMNYDERLLITSGGYVYHPALMSFNIGMSPTWRQGYSSSSGDKHSNRTFDLAYNAGASFLNSKPYTISMFASKILSTTSSSQAQRIRRELTSYGSRLNLKFDKLPMTFMYTKDNNQYYGFSDSETDEEKFRINLSFKEVMGRTRGKYKYITKDHFARNIKTSTDRETVRLTNSITKDNKSFSTRYDFSKVKGGSGVVRRYGINETINWRHTKNLKTNYRMSYAKFEHVASIRESASLNFGLQHFLYENLTTSLSSFRSMSWFAGITDDHYGLAGSLRYRRRIPWGNLSLSTSQSYRASKRDTKDNFIEVKDESAVLTIGEVTLLQQENIDINSIAVKDTDGNPFTEGTDYLVDKTGSFVRIICVIGGAIDDTPPGADKCSTGASVLVDYKYENLFTNTAFHSQSYGIQLDFWKLQNRYSYSRGSQIFLSGPSPASLSDSRTHKAGTSLRFNWKYVGSLTNVNFVDSRSISQSTRSWRINENISARLSRTLFLSFKGSYKINKFDDEDEAEIFKGISSKVQIVTSRRTRLDISGFLNNSESVHSSITSFGIVSVFNWIYYAWSGNIQYRFSESRNDFSNTIARNHHFRFKIKRALF